MYHYKAIRKCVSTARNLYHAVDLPWFKNTFVIQTTENAISYKRGKVQ